MRKVLFGTVIYKQALIFLKSYIECLKVQTKKEFDLIFIYDDLTQTNVEDMKRILNQSEFKGHFYIVPGRSKTGYISDYRIQMLLEAYEKEYELLIIGDIDDLFSANRVEMVYRDYMKNPHATFYYNMLVDFDGASILKCLPDKVDSVKIISQCNFLGMSNTAINLSRLTKEFIESLYIGACDVFDWYLYSRILLTGGYGILVKDAKTIYRIYEGNLVGLQGNRISEILREKNVKIEHYQRLEAFSEAFATYREKLESIDINESFYKTKYYNKNNQGYWWNNIHLEK